VLVFDGSDGVLDGEEPDLHLVRGLANGDTLERRAFFANDGTVDGIFPNKIESGQTMVASYEVEVYKVEVPK